MTDTEFMTLAILTALSFGGNPRRKSFRKYGWFGEHQVDRLTELPGQWMDNKHPKQETLDALNLAEDVLNEARPPWKNCKKHPQLEKQPFKMITSPLSDRKNSEK